MCTRDQNIQLTFVEVESLLDEFNSSGTSNDKKREIETRLREFQNNINSWQLCLQNIQNYHNQFVWFFNASTVEIAISRNWNCLVTADRTTIRNFLWTTYTNLSIDSTKFQRNKIAQLLSLMAKREFPDDHPSYMNDIVELLKNKFLLGIVLIRTTSEELVSTKEDISSERKKYFHSCLSMCMPEIFDLLNKFLAIFVCRILKTNFEEIPNEIKELRLSESLPSDNHFSDASLELLECIQHLFSWIPLDDLVSDFLLNSLFLLSKWNTEYSECSVAAITTISELFYRQIAIPLPHTIANGIMQLLQQDNLKISSEMYQDKLTELLRLFTTQQSSKWIKDDTFPNLLWYLYQFTFAGYGALAFTERLAIWTPIIKGLVPTGFSRYNEILLALVSGILEKMQFQNDQNDGYLEVLDNVVLDDDMETEWQHFLRQCIETIALVAEGSTEQVIELVANAWRNPFEVFLVFEKAIINEEITWNTNDQSKCHYIHCVLRDLSSLCQTFSRLAPILEGCSNRVTEFVLTVAISLILTIKFLATKKPYKLNIFNEEIRNDFIETFAQMLSALRGLLPWSSELKFEVYMNSVIDMVAQLLLPVQNYNNQEPKLITLSAAQLLLSISSVLRPQCLIERIPVTQIVQAGSNLSYLDKQTSSLVYKSICNCFVLPWPNVSNNEQNFNVRANHLQEYISCLGHDLLEMDHSVGTVENGKVVQVTSIVLPILKDILDYYEEGSSVTKQILLSAYKPIIEKSLLVFNNFSSTNHEINDHILCFGLSIIRTLQIQLGTAYIKEILGIFLNACTRENITANRIKTIDKLLQIIYLVVKNPGNATQSLLPAILELSLDHVVPFLALENNWIQNTDILASLFTLFDGILLNHWQYFYKATVLRRLKPGCGLRPASPTEKIQHTERFLAIMSLYGRALLSGNDPHISRTVLKSLQNLNEHWKLYHKEIFQSHLLSSFQYALINCLVSPEGALCYDLLVNVLFTMGQVNTTLLHESFMSYGYPPDAKLLQDICVTTDLPTFSYRMGQLIQDTRCGQFFNSPNKTL